MADQDTTPQSQLDMFREAMAPAETPAEQPPPPAVTEPEAPAPVTAPPPPPETSQEPSGIPAWRLKEEIEARREAEARFRQLEEYVRQNQAGQPKPAQPTFFDNPNEAATRLIVQQLQPFVEHTHQQMMALGKMVADNAYGADVVSAAEQAFLEARDNRTLDPVDYERVVQSPNRYAECVRWHQNNSVVETVGGNLDTWFEKQLEAKMADPKFQASMLEKMRTGARPGTAVQIPPSLSKVTAARSNGPTADDAGDAALFAFAMGKKS